MSDGEHVVYQRVIQDNGPAVYEFVIYDPAGAPPVVWPVPSVWDDYGFSLSPDGSELLYTVSGQPPEIWSLDLANGSSRFIRYGAGGSISPDGQWLAYGTPDDSIAVEPVGAAQAAVQVVVAEVRDTGRFCRRLCSDGLPFHVAIVFIARYSLILMKLDSQGISLGSRLTI